MAEGLLARLGLRFPIIQAPMAGGVDTPALVAEVSKAGGLGSIGGAYISARQLEDAAAEVRRRTDKPFSVNLFVRGPAPEVPADALDRARRALAPFRAELGLPAEPAADAKPDTFEQQLEAALRVRPALFSFTFGALAKEHLQALHAQSIPVMGTATTVAEALLLEALGVDAICAQGSEAGGHRGTFLGEFDDALIGTMALTPLLVAAVRIPVVAAGGLMNGRSIAAVLRLGAAAAQLGTAFMRCPEAGTSAPHRKALASDAAHRTVVTRSFSGRAARGIRNRFADALAQAPGGIAPFPVHQSLTKEIRAAAVKQGRTDLMQMWAGQGAPLGRELPAGELVAMLAREAGLQGG